MTMRWKWPALAGLLLAAALAAPALAHHSATMYDRAHPITAQVEVKSFQWINPHCYLTVVVPGPAGSQPKTLMIEMTSPGVLTRAGWTKRTFSPGDKITLEYGPMRNGAPAGFFNKATLSDGKVLRYDFGETTVLK